MYLKLWKYKHFLSRSENYILSKIDKLKKVKELCKKVGLNKYYLVKYKSRTTSWF